MSDVMKAKKVAGVKEIDAAKTARIPIKIVPQPMLRKPEWIRMKIPDSARFQEIKRVQTICTRCAKKPAAPILANALAAALPHL